MRDQVLELLRDKKMHQLQDILKAINPADVADIMQGLFEDKALHPEELPVFFRLLPKDTAADTFAELELDAQQALIAALSDGELREVISDMFADDAADLLDELPANVVKRILKNVDPDVRRDINSLMGYPEDSAGSIMTTEFVSLKTMMTVQQAFARIRQTGVDKETIYTCYVTAPGGKLLGLVSVKDLLLADYDDIIGSIMEQNVISCHTLEDQEAVARLFRRYGFTALPVVDTENRLVGIVTVDDAITVLEEEATEDMEVMAAMTPSDKPYLKTGTLEIYKSRIPWLLVLMLSATFTGMIIRHFEGALAACVVLTTFIPMLMNTGGNSGSQSSVTVIRGLSVGDLAFADLARILWKEARVAILCGLTLSVCNFAKLMVFDRVGLLISAVVCLTLLVTVCIAKLVGCSLPLLAKKLGFDPAVMASPFLTTIVDAIALLVYFRFASGILNI